MKNYTDFYGKRIAVGDVMTIPFGEYIGTARVIQISDDDELSFEGIGKVKIAEHKHIPHKHPDWSAHNYQCVCGFKTGSIQEFDMHLKENDNQKIHPTKSG